MSKLFFLQEFFYLCICSLKFNVNGTNTGLLHFSQSFTSHEGT